MRTVIRNERGGTLLLYTVAMVGMMGMAALAIDLGMLREAKAEAQRAADAASLAGASAFQLDLLQADQVDSANARANRVAADNYMNGVAFDPPTEVTVWVIPESVKVRVKARRAAVPTWFARIFGLNSFPVGAVAAAEAAYASGASCVKPLAIPDWWHDGDNDLNGNRLPDPGESWQWDPANDVYHPAHYDSDSPADGFPNDGDGTGLGSEWRNVPIGTSPGVRDWGRQVVLRPPVQTDDMEVQVCPGTFGELQGGKCYVPSWWGYWGGTPVANSFAGCGLDAQLGVDVETTTGNMGANVGTAVDAIIGQDPGASWSDVAIDSITGRTGTVIGSTFSGKWRSSPRAWTVAVVAPSDAPTGPGGSDGIVQFNNFMTFFIEGCIWADGTPGITNCGPPNPPGKAIVGRFIGQAKGTSAGPAPGSMVRILRLVE